jgi:hypothetical protein
MTNSPGFESGAGNAHKLKGPFGACLRRATRLWLPGMLECPRVWTANDDAIEAYKCAPHMIERAGIQMNEQYIRSLGSKVLKYTERQAENNPDDWQRCVDIALDFSSLAKDENWSVDAAREILRRAEACGDRGSVWYEMKLALRSIAGG